MRDEREVDARLTEELSKLRRRVAELSSEANQCKRLAEALRRAEERWRSLLKHAPANIVVTDLRGTISYANRAMFGKGADEAKETGLFEYIPAEYHDDLRRVMEDVLRTGKADRYELPIASPDGTTRSWSGRIGPVKDAGQTVGFIIVGADVTERKQADDTMRRRLELEKVVSSVSSRFAETSDIDKAIDASLEEVGRLSGASRAYLFLLREDGAVMDNTHEWCAEGVTPQIGNLQNLPSEMAPWWMMKLHRGEVIHIMDVSLMPPEAAAERKILESQDIKSVLVLPVTIAGQLAGFVGFDDVVQTGEWSENDLVLLQTTSEIVGNALQRRRAEKALQQKITELDSFINNIPDMAWLKDTKSNFIAANKAFGDAVGMEPAYLTGHTCEVCFGEEAAAKFKEDDRKVMGSRQQTRIEESIKDARGNTVHLETIKSPIFSETGEVVGTVGVARDITERKRAEERLKAQEAELRRSNAELERFAYIASHDLQEPLRMVTSFLQLLERHCADKLDAEAHEFIAFAVDGAKRMQSLINDLLAYSRAGTRGKPFQQVDCETVLDRALANLAVAIEESGAEITRDPLPTVMGDDTQLVQLFQNLIDNAIKFRGREAPRVHVAVERRGNNWRFCVRDNGIGVESRYFKRIFAVFQRLHGRDDYPGTGIGLAVCQRIVERHKGTIGIESEPGKGTTFHFTIPATADKTGGKRS